MMKKVISTLIAAALCMGFAFAQDLNQATDTYNNGATALSTGDKAGALNYFTQALEIASKLGEPGVEIANNCKNVIPNIHLEIAKDFAREAQYDQAVAKLKETVSVAGQFGDEGVAASAKELIPQILMQKGSSLLGAKDFAGAAEAYKAVLAENPANAQAALRLGQALNGAGDAEGAIAAFEQAAANGQEKAAHKQISVIHLRKAAGALKAKDPKAAVESANKAIEFDENATQAYYIAGNASSILKKNNDAIGYFEKYLSLAPNAKNAAQIAFTVAALYQQNGNKEKAKEYYQKVLTDPKLGPEAQKQVAALK